MGGSGAPGEPGTAGGRARQGRPAGRWPLGHRRWPRLGCAGPGVLLKSQPRAAKLCAKTEVASPLASPVGAVLRLAAGAVPPPCCQPARLHPRGSKAAVSTCSLPLAPSLLSSSLPLSVLSFWLLSLPLFSPCPAGLPSPGHAVPQLPAPSHLPSFAEGTLLPWLARTRDSPQNPPCFPLAFVCFPTLSQALPRAAGEHGFGFTFMGFAGCARDGVRGRQRKAELSLLAAFLSDRESTNVVRERRRAGRTAGFGLTASCLRRDVGCLCPGCAWRAGCPTGLALDGLGTEGQRA